MDPSTEHTRSTSLSPTESPRGITPLSSPASPPWAFAPYYGKDLPATLNFDPVEGTGQFITYIQELAKEQSVSALPRVNPVVASFQDRAQKATWLNDPYISDVQRDYIKLSSTSALAAKGFTSAGSIGVVISSMSNAAELASTNSSSWHAVAVARIGDQVWVHDSAFELSDYEGVVRSMSRVKGVCRLRDIVHNPALKSVKDIWFQGPPPAYTLGPAKLECTGRSAQWVQATLDGTLPWPPNANSSGGNWARFSRN